MRSAPLPMRMLPASTMLIFLVLLLCIPCFGQTLELRHGVKGLEKDPCKCSPTGRGYPPLTLIESRNLRDRLCILNATVRTDLLRSSMIKRVYVAAKEVRYAYGYEGLMNLDAFLRTRSPIIVCSYNLATGMNFERDSNGTTSLKPCDQIPEFRSKDEVIARFKPSPAPKIKAKKSFPTAVPIPNGEQYGTKNECPSGLASYAPIPPLLQ